jgi:hypothetical protein
LIQFTWSKAGESSVFPGLRVDFLATSTETSFLLRPRHSLRCGRYLLAACRKRPHYRTTEVSTGSIRRDCWASCKEPEDFSSRRTGMVRAGCHYIAQLPPQKGRQEKPLLRICPAARTRCARVPPGEQRQRKQHHVYAEPPGEPDQHFGSPVRPLAASAIE